MEVAISPYVVRFAIAYTVALIAVGAVLTVLEVNGSSSGSIASLFAGVVIDASGFVKNEKRVPSPSERKKLTWLSLVASYVISLGLAVAVLAALGQLEVIKVLPSLVAEVGTGIVIGSLLFVTVLYGLVLWFSYGWFAKMQFNTMQKKGEI